MTAVLLGENHGRLLQPAGRELQDWTERMARALRCFTTGMIVDLIDTPFLKHAEMAAKKGLRGRNGDIAVLSTCVAAAHLEMLLCFEETTERIESEAERLCAELRAVWAASTVTTAIAIVCTAYPRKRQRIALHKIRFVHRLTHKDNTNTEECEAHSTSSSPKAFSASTISLMSPGSPNSIIPYPPQLPSVPKQGAKVKEDVSLLRPYKRRKPKDRVLPLHEAVVLPIEQATPVKGSYVLKRREKRGAQLMEFIDRGATVAENVLLLLDVVTSGVRPEGPASPAPEGFRERPCEGVLVAPKMVEMQPPPSVLQNVLAVSKEEGRKGGPLSAVCALASVCLDRCKRPHGSALRGVEEEAVQEVEQKVPPWLQVLERPERGGTAGYRPARSAGRRGGGGRPFTAVVRG